MMPKESPIELLNDEPNAWNTWRKLNPNISPDLKKIVLYKKNLDGVNLDGANLRESDLRGASLNGANLTKSTLYDGNLRGASLRRSVLYRADLDLVDMIGTNLHKANLRKTTMRLANAREANFSGADLGEADLRQANLIDANLAGANLEHTKLDGAILYNTIFGDTDLSGVTGLKDCIHLGPSILDHRTIAQSRGIPIEFLRGCGLPDFLIENASNLQPGTIQFYSCFISYSSRDEAFSHKLYTDLQESGVRCWFAPEDMKIGEKIRPTIDRAIHSQEKVLLILSASSIQSQWVEQEVEKALEKERRENETVLFPIQIDDSALSEELGWASYLKNTRNIGDFTKWKASEHYQGSLKRLIKDLKITHRKSTSSV